MTEPGYRVFGTDPAVLRWSRAAAATLPQAPASGLRHGGTWNVGLDALPNNADGSVNGVPLVGPWPVWEGDWHRAQVSEVFPGYPRRDPDESEVAHRYRKNRDAAHLDGLLPIGPDRRRYLKEPHAFVLGIPLTVAQDSPLVVWAGSHRVMQQALREVLLMEAPETWGEIDLTEVYHAARRTVFEACERIELPMVPGQSVWLHRHLVHGVAPWKGSMDAPPRRIAYFRPLLSSVADWL